MSCVVSSQPSFSICGQSVKLNIILLSMERSVIWLMRLMISSSVSKSDTFSFIMRTAQPSKFSTEGVPGKPSTSTY